jgi:hypothetical protein
MWLTSIDCPYEDQNVRASASSWWKLNLANRLARLKEKQSSIRLKDCWLPGLQAEYEHIE